MLFLLKVHDCLHPVCSHLLRGRPKPYNKRSCELPQLPQNSFDFLLHLLVSLLHIRGLVHITQCTHVNNKQYSKQYSKH